MEQYKHYKTRKGIRKNEKNSNKNSSVVVVVIVTLEIIANWGNTAKGSRYTYG
jgi:hypothetical protein